mgnify:FL=1
MLFQFVELKKHISRKIVGVLHIGAHECKELKAYVKEEIVPEKIYWIEALTELVEENKKKGIVNIFQGVVDKKDNAKCIFNVRKDDVKYSSLLVNDNEGNVDEQRLVKTVRMDTLIRIHNIQMMNVNYLHVDIGGTELRAMKSMKSFMHHMDYVYVSVNTLSYMGDTMFDVDSFLNKYGLHRVCEKVNKCSGKGEAFYSRSQNFGPIR